MHGIFSNLSKKTLKHTKEIWKKKRRKILIPLSGVYNVEKCGWETHERSKKMNLHI